jgi:hypothetical protein
MREFARGRRYLHVRSESPVECLHSSANISRYFPATIHSYPVVISKRTLASVSEFGVWTRERDTLFADYVVRVHQEIPSLKEDGTCGASSVSALLSELRMHS